MITYDQHGPHGSGSGPIWIVNAPTADYPDERFDGVTPPLDPQQPTPEQIADAARLAVPNMAIVFRHWGYIQTHPLPELRALLDMLTPPAPKWTATEDEDEEAQNTEVPVLQAENATGMVEGRSGDHNPLDVQLLPARPTRQASEDAERLVNLLCGIAGATWPLTSRYDAIWLRDMLLGWLNSLLYRGALLGYSNESLTAVRDALDAMQL